MIIIIIIEPIIIINAVYTGFYSISDILQELTLLLT